MKKKIFVTILATVLACFLVIQIFPNEYEANVTVSGNVPQVNTNSSAVNATAAPTPQTTQAPQTQAPTDAAKPDTDTADNTVSDSTSDESANGKTDVDNTVAADTDVSGDDASSSSKMPETTEEIITKYAEVLKKFKQEKPAYTKKEYQALPEESRQFSSSLVNKLLGFADNYMVKEDSEDATVVREKGYADIINEIPIYGLEDGCLLTDYSAVKNATCVDNGDGNYKISFSLQDEVNPTPLASGSTQPQSYHAAVLMPGNRDEIMVEVNKVEKMTGATCNSFDLTYRDCTFECVYNPENDQVVSITHHANIDIDADIHFITDITGSARLTNDMLVYDIVW